MSDNKPPHISIIIPAFNEAARMKQSLLDLKSFFKTWPIDHEIILVIEKSTDDSLNIAQATVGEDPHFHIIANQVHKGKGFAVRTGMLRARGQFVFYMDLDLSTPLVEVMAFLGHFEACPKTDIVIGSRQHPHSEIIVRQSGIRQKMGQMFNVFVQTMAMSGIKDTQCGFKAFRAKTVQPIFSRQKLNGFSFDVEVLMIARRLGYVIDVLPVKWINSRESKVRIVKDSAKMLLDLLRVRWVVRKNLKKNIPATDPIDKKQSA